MTNQANKLLVDSSFLYALADPADKYHAQALKFAQLNLNRRVVPIVILPEVTYLLQRFVHYSAATFLSVLAQSDAELVTINQSDLTRVSEIRSTYGDAQFDFVDCCIMSLSERLNITMICTFDRRDFVIFRPAHCDYLELLP